MGCGWLGVPGGCGSLAGVGPKQDLASPATLRFQSPPVLAVCGATLQPGGDKTTQYCECLWKGQGGIEVTTEARVGL